MTGVRPQISWLRLASDFRRLVESEVHAAARQIPCWVVLGLGLGNLLAGLVFGTEDWLPTFVALDFVYANFAFAPWIAVVYLGAQEPRVPSGIGLAAKTAALSLVAAAMLALAGIAAIACQLWKGGAPLDWTLLTAGLYANLGWGTVHLAMLAVALRAILGSRWLSMAATAILWTATNLGFEHPLLRFGAPVAPGSGINGLGPFLVPLVALGVHWTGFCVVLLGIGRWVAGRRDAKAGGPPSSPLGPIAFAVIWTSTVTWVVSGGWIFVQAEAGGTLRAEADRIPSPDTLTPQPVYSRLDLDVAIDPIERVLVSRGTAIVVNRRRVPIPELHFGVPPEAEAVVLTTTGAHAGIDPTTGHHRYRLNRPLEPGETLKLAYELVWIAGDFGADGSDTRLVENGTFVSTADIVPALGHASHGHPFTSAPAVAFRARISTSNDQIVVTEGTLVRAWKEDGWSFFEYESGEPISPFATIHAGHYAIRREEWDEGVVEVFHHPRHRGRVNAMLDHGRAAVARRAASARGVPVLVRVVEIPGYSPFRGPRFLGFGNARTPPKVATGTILPYSERGYPLSRPPPSGSTPPRA